MESGVTLGQRARWYLALCMTLTAAPVVLDLLLSDRRRPFGYFAPDAFYYFTVARNAAESGAMTFDQSLTTNGYHPLWQWLLTGIFKVSDLLGFAEVTTLHVVLALQVAFVCLGFYALFAALRRTGRLTALVAAIPLGAYALLLVPIWLVLGSGGLAAQDPFGNGAWSLPGTGWSAMNGMETSLVVLCFGFLAWSFVAFRTRATTRSALALGLSLALLTLARLDQGVITVGIIGWVCLGFVRERERRSAAALVLLAFMVPVSIYLVFNMVRFGHPLPVSGQLKSSFPHVTGQNFDDIASLLSGERKYWLMYLVRVALIAVPVAVAFSYGMRAVRDWRRARKGNPVLPPSSHMDLFVTLLIPGVILLATYDLLFVPLLEQGEWYAPISMIFVTLAPLVFHANSKPLQRIESNPSARRLLLLGLGALTVVVFVSIYRQPTRHERFADFYYVEAPRLRTTYSGKEPKLLSLDDGIVAFATGFPTMSGTGLMLDREGVTRMREKKLLTLAVSRGYSRVTSMAYATNLNQLRSVMVQVLGLAEFEAHRFTLEYRSPSGLFYIVRAESLASPVQDVPQSHE